MLKSSHPVAEKKSSKRIFLAFMSEVLPGNAPISSDLKGKCDEVKSKQDGINYFADCAFLQSSKKLWLGQSTAVPLVLLRL